LTAKQKINKKKTKKNKKMTGSTNLKKQYVNEIKPITGRQQSAENTLNSAAAELTFGEFLGTG